METTLKVKLISHTLNPELVIATAGKLCYSPSNIDDLMEKQTDESIERFGSLFSCFMLKYSYSSNSNDDYKSN